MPILVICPLNRECDLLLEYWHSAGVRIEKRPCGRLKTWHVPEWGIVLSAGGTGKAQFALQTQYLLDHLEPCTRVLCAGAAGSLSQEVAAGDVVIGSETVEHDRKGRFFPKPLPRFHADAEALNLAKGIRGNGFRIHFGPIASGDEDIVEPERRRQVQEATGAVAVAWEGAGGARACAFNQVAFLEIRGITDTADQSAPADFDRSLPLAMGNVAAMLENFLRIVLV